MSEVPTVDFKFSPEYFFDTLPNNIAAVKVEVPEKGEKSSPDHDLKATPRWYQASRAPVPFSEEVFWKVMDRWVLEAPSIIPPVSSVEILQDQKVNTNATQESVTPTDSVYHHHCLESGGLRPFRSIHRKLLPKRTDKDPVMQERLYFCRRSGDSLLATNGTATSHPATPMDTDESCATSLAVFVPVCTVHESAGEGQDSVYKNEMAVMNAVLPYYYPKVRGFRYGYNADREEALEDMDDAHEEEEEVEEGKSGSSTATAKAKSKKSIKKSAKRLGWITLDLFLAGDEGAFTKKMQSAFTELFKKLFKWGVNTTKGFTESRVQHDVVVPKDLYLTTYARMKDTHAQKWVQSWPEKTDPRKFVFEDIAIAAWLVALWEMERKEQQQEAKTEAVEGVMDGLEGGPRKQTFVDLGCGNGLLTHLLNEEGHQGRGVDIVARKVWDIYGPGTRLEAETIIPNETTFEDVDWIIGNHADELAPWIPIIASRSNPLTKFVVIPCCFFGLSGRYQFPGGAPDGKYKAYQDHICQIIDICGYELETEILRIPSTKNVALIGRRPKRKRSRSCLEQDKVEDAPREKVLKKDGTNDDGYVKEEIKSKSMEVEVEAEEQQDANVTKERVDELVRQCGIFVPRVSDKERQELQKLKSKAKKQAAQDKSSAEVQENDAN